MRALGYETKAVRRGHRSAGELHHIGGWEVWEQGTCSSRRGGIDAKDLLGPRSRDRQHAQRALDSAEHGVHRGVSAKLEYPTTQPVCFGEAQAGMLSKSPTASGAAAMLTLPPMSNAETMQLTNVWLGIDLEMKQVGQEHGALGVTDEDDAAAVVVVRQVVGEARP